MQKQQVILFDTTLRDGQQCPGAGMSLAQNIEYAKLVAAAGIDVIEAGFPAASQLDFTIVENIAGEVVTGESSPMVAGLCQLREAQVDKTINALMPAVKLNKALLHVYLPVDPNLMRASLGKFAEDKAQILKDMAAFVERGVQSGLQVEFSPEGYSRIGDNFDFVSDVLRAAISAGASVINCPDTIGGACKRQGEDYFIEKMKVHAMLMEKEFPDKKVAWSVHCHNDFGLALENSINAVFEGVATQIEGCFNGIGERSGNVALEQCIMYIKHFGVDKKRELAYFTQFDSARLQAVSDFVCEHMLVRQPHWPITGDNAAKHTSGGHTNAILKDPLAYQPFDPKEIGKEISFVFGPMSGGNLAKSIIERNGYRCNADEKAEIAQFIKQHYDERRKGITDEELMQAYFEYCAPMRISAFDYIRTGEMSTLQLTGRFFDQEDAVKVQYKGDESALAALHSAISQYMPGVDIETYHSSSAEKGVSAESESTIVIKTQAQELYTGIGLDQDIKISALKALIDAVNRAYVAEHFLVKE